MNHHTNKKTYQKPFMDVVELHQDLQLLTGSSGVLTNSRSYGSAVTSSWETSENDDVSSYDEYIQYLSTLRLLN